MPSVTVGKWENRGNSRSTKPWNYPSLPENSCPPIVKNLIYGHSWRQLFPTISTVLNGAIPSSVNLNTNFRQLPINIILCLCCTSFRVGAIFPDIIVESSRYLNCEPFDLCSITLSNRCWDRCWDYSTWLSNKWIFSRGEQFFQFWIFQLRLVRLLEVLEERKDWKIVKVIASILYLLFQANTYKHSSTRRFIMHLSFAQLETQI